MTNWYEIIGYPLFLIAGLELLLGFILLKQNRANSPVNTTVAAIAFFSSAFALCTGTMYIRASLGLSYNFYARINWIGWFTLCPALQFLYYIKDENSRAARLIGRLLYPFWSLMLVLSVKTDLIVTNTYALIPFVNRPGTLEKPVRLFGAILALWVIMKVLALRKRASGFMKKELNSFYYGVLIFGGGAGATSGFLQLFGGFGLEPGLGSYFSLPWVLLTFYAIARYSLFDIRIIISRSVGTVVLVLFFSAVQAALFSLFAPSLGPVLSIFTTLPLIGVLFFGTSFSRTVQQWINSIIIKNRYDYQEVLKNSTNAMATILKLDDLLGHIMDSTSKSLGVKNACLYLSGKNGAYIARHGFGVSRETIGKRCLADIIVQWIRESKQTVLREQLESLLPDERAESLVTYLRGIRAEVVVPIFYQGQLLGALSLGPRAGHEPYTQSDILLLETLAGHAAVAIENATLFQESERVKESLLESEGKFRALAETIPAAIFIHQGGKFLYANPAGEHLSGYSLDEILNREFLDIVHPEFRDLVRERAAGRLQGKEMPAQYEFKIIRKDGEERWAIMSAALMDYQGKPSVIGTVFDITERKSLESRLFSMQKMEAIGKLAGGVAHDFNNILTGIVGHSSLLQASLRQDDPLQSHIDQILSCTERAAALTHRLFTYGSRKGPALQPCDLTSLVSQQEKFLSGVLRDDIRLAMRANGALPVLADTGQIERTIMNLVMNARDAMPRGGTISVETGRTRTNTGGASAASQGSGRPGDYAFFSVQDTGIGMDESIRKRIFKPFFTTKGEGKGAGFGLSIVHDIVKDHNGYITVSSRPGMGSTFTIHLPLAPAAQGRAAPVPASAPAGGHETILLVEDDEAARKYTKTVFEESGYTVMEAGDGEEAVNKFRENRNGIHLVITDIIMPKMNGREVYNAVKKIRPDVKVLFTSGYAEDLLVNTGIMEPGQPFLLKPASRKETLAKTRETLDDYRS